MAGVSLAVVMGFLRRQPCSLFAFASFARSSFVLNSPGPAVVYSAVLYRSGPIELDLARRELRCAGVVHGVQPQIFQFLAHLLTHRDRVVRKRELLDALWPDTVVSEGSLQRVASTARAALGEDGRELIRTYPGHGYRWVGEVSEHPDEPAPAAATTSPFKPRYARSGDVHVAYCTLGHGDLDLVLVLGWALPMQALFTLPPELQPLEPLAELGRVITFDKRGTGLSDRVKDLPTLAQRAADLRAVLDEVRSERAIVLGISEGAPLAIAFAAAHPERVAGLVLVGAFPRMASADDYACGWKRSQLGELSAYVKNAWGAGRTLLALIPTAEQARLRDWACAAERAGASPGAALELLEMNALIDVREQLPQLRVPTLVLHAREDRVIALENGRYLAEHIPGAELRVVEGDDHAFLFRGRPHLHAAVRDLLRRTAAQR